MTRAAERLSRRHPHSDERCTTRGDEVRDTDPARGLWCVDGHVQPRGSGS